jgi:hypothetical protein
MASFDLLHYQTLAAVSRFINGAMILLAVAFGVSIVIAVAGIDISRQPAPELAYPLKLLLRALASFLAASALAMLFNTPPARGARGRSFGFGCKSGESGEKIMLRCGLRGSHHPMRLAFV